MVSKPPEPPKGWPKYLRDGIPKQDVETLREIAQYADELAVDKIEAAEAELEQQSEDEDDLADEWEDDKWEDVVEDAYDKADLARSKGSITVNHIDGRGYYYLKWSENGEFKSQYIAPVEPKERGSSD